MNLMRKLSSRSFFVFNLVLIGVIFGFSLAFLSFSCTTPRSHNVAQAQEITPVMIPQDALSVAVGLQTTLRAVTDRVLPSVVEVKTVSVQRRQQGGTPRFDGIPWDFFFGPRRPEGQGQGQDREFRSRGMGSGIIIRHDRGTYYVLTNNHVIDGVAEIIIGALDGTEYTAEVVGRDPRRDLAVLSFRSNARYPIVVLGDSDDVRVGDWAIAMGNPLGEQFSFSVTMGIVSAVGRTGGPGGNINDFIQTDASINQGNSGGPLVNIRGEVIGINTWIASNIGGGSVGLGFAIPINNAIRTIDEIIRTGAVSDGWLGVSLLDPDRGTLTAMGITDPRGSKASQVFLGSPADVGGIRAGDFITHVNGNEVRGSNQLTQMVGNIRPGDTAVFRVIRDRSSQEFTVRVVERTTEIAADSRRLWPGVMVVYLTDEMRATLNVDSDAADGLFVAQVISETPAAIVGLQRGDRITSVNNTPVTDLASFYRALRERTETELWFGFVRGESTLESLRFRR
ncbi:MAG: Do family serine endopeptidase [Treponema sp.]|nr:Do family serine endopeptidase [Treponema sp.]MCL2233024.1 Do family serine endopeptidase [Treponema sp.]